MNRLIYLVPFVVFAVLVFYFAAGLQRDPKILPSALINKPLPDFSLKAIEGGSGPGLSSDDLKKGTVSVLNVFASWCIPCRAEHPVITRLVKTKAAPVYGLNYKDKAPEALRWLTELGDPYAAIGADTTGRVGIDLGVYGIPETFVVDGKGIVRYKHVGPVTDKLIRNEILPAIEAAKK